MLCGALVPGPNIQLSLSNYIQTINDGTSVMFEKVVSYN